MTILPSSVIPTAPCPWLSLLKSENWIPSDSDDSLLRKPSELFVENIFKPFFGNLVNYPPPISENLSHYLAFYQDLGIVVEATASLFLRQFELWSKNTNVSADPANMLEIYKKLADERKCKRIKKRDEFPEIGSLDIIFIPEYQNPSPESAAHTTRKGKFYKPKLCFYDPQERFFNHVSGNKKIDVRKIQLFLEEIGVRNIAPYYFHDDTTKEVFAELGISTKITTDIWLHVVAKIRESVPNCKLTPTFSHIRKYCLLSNTIEFRKLGKKSC